MVKSLFFHVPYDNATAVRALQEIYGARHREMWNALPSLLLRGSKLSYNKEYNFYDAVFPDGDRVKLALTVLELDGVKSATIYLVMKRPESVLAQCNAENIARRIMSIIEANLRKYPPSVFVTASIIDDEERAASAAPS